MVYFLTLLACTLASEVKYQEIVFGLGPSQYEFTPSLAGYTAITGSSPLPLFIFLRKDKAASETEYDLKHQNSFILSPSYFNSTSSYFLFISCESDFSLLLSTPSYTSLLDSLPMQKTLSEGFQDLFTYSALSNSILKVSLTYFLGSADLLISEIDPNHENAMITENWHFGKTLTIHVRESVLLKISIVGFENTDYTLVVDCGKDVQIQTEPVPGLVHADELNKYLYVVPADADLKIKLSIFSGECDLYVKVGSSAGLHDYDWAFTDHGSKVVEILKKDQKEHPGNNYFIAVFGKKASAYLLIVTSNQVDVTRMVPGLPYIGTVNYEEFEYFTSEVIPDQTLQIHLSAATGNPDIYAKICNGTCTFTKEDVLSPSSLIAYSNNTYSLEELSLSGQGNFTIGVYGASADPSDFTIVSIVNNTEVLLKAGTPQTGMLPYKGYRYYKYHLSTVTSNEIYFMLTPTSGNPDLYVSLTGPPSTTIYDSSSILSGLEVDSIIYKKGRDYSTLNGTYHIAVYSEAPTRYSIVVKEIHPNGNTTIQLYPGISQKDTLYDSCMRDRLYFFPIHFNNDTKQTIRITLTPITGKFNLYATNRIENIDFTKRIFWYHWMANSSSTDLVNSIVIPPKDPYYLMNSNYAVLVKSMGFASDKSATYSIVFQVGNGTMILSENFPFTDTIVGNTYNYYTFPVIAREESISIRLTAFTGKPKLYISANDTYPSAAHYEFASNRIGSDEVIISWPELSQKCPGIPEIYHHGDPTYCSLYISVYSSVNSVYSLIVHSKKEIITLLLMPSTHISLLSPDNKYYYSLALSEQNVFINVQPSAGDVKVFVKLYSSMQADIYDVAMPNSTFFDATSEVYMLHTERVSVTSEMMSNLCGINCLIAITTVCIGECEFFISITQENTIALIDGITHLGSVGQDDFSYFTYYCDREDQDFIIVLSPISSGDPDMYVKKSLDELPSKFEYDWKAQTWKSETLIISRTDPLLKTGIKGTYIIGVYGFDPCSFTIKVTQNPQKVTKLISGIPAHGNVNSGSMQYFYYQSSISKDILIKVTPISGKAVIYANTQGLYSDELYEKLPTLNSYIWTSLESAGQHSLLIPATSSNFCTSCNIVIAIYGQNDCIYSLSVTHDMKISLLENGVPQRAEINKNEWKFYYFEVLEKSDIDISLNTFSGDSDLFVSTNEDLDFDNAMWASILINKLDHIQISENDKHFKTGGFYIGVYTLFPSTFSLTAHIRKSFVTLISGWPQTYSITKFDTLYFQYPSSLVEQNLFCNLHPLEQDFRPTVYVLTSSKKKYPNATTSTYTFTNKNYEEYYSWLHLNFTLRTNEAMYMAVVGYTESPGDFQLYCSGANDTTVLSFNRPVVEKLEFPIKKRTYEVNVEKKSELSVYVVPCAGMQKLEISSNWTVASMQGPDIVINRLTDGRMIGTLNNAFGRYYITVTTTDSSSYFQGSSYEILTYLTGNRENNVIVPGNDGEIIMSQHGENIKLTWGGPMYSNLTAFTTPGTHYLLYSTDSQEATTACSILTAYSRKRATLIKDTNDTMFTYTDHEATVINLLAALPYNSSAFRYISYDPIRLEPGKAQNSKIGLWVLFLLVLLALMVIGYFVRRTRKIQQQLDIELTQARNIPMKGNEKIPLTKAAE